MDSKQKALKEKLRGDTTLSVNAARTIWRGLLKRNCKDMSLEGVSVFVLKKRGDELLAELWRDCFGARGDKTLDDVIIETTNEKRLSVSQSALLKYISRNAKEKEAVIRRAIRGANKDQAELVARAKKDKKKPKKKD